MALAAAWGSVGWLRSDVLRRRKPQIPRKHEYAKIEKYKRDRRRYLVWSLSLPIALVALSALSAFAANRKKQEKILSEYEGFLVPGDKPDPPSFCSESSSSPFSLGSNALKVFMGRNEAFASRFTYVVLRVHQYERMVIDRHQAGRIALSLDILDGHGKAIVTFEKGHFYCRPIQYPRHAAP